MSVTVFSREMKKGNVGVVFEILGKKLKDSLGRTVDFGLTGKDGMVHPSLTVSKFGALLMRSNHKSLVINIYMRERERI